MASSSLRRSLEEPSRHPSVSIESTTDEAGAPPALPLTVAAVAAHTAATAAAAAADDGGAPVMADAEVAAAAAAAGARSFGDAPPFLRASASSFDTTSSRLAENTTPLAAVAASSSEAGHSAAAATAAPATAPRAHRQRSGSIPALGPLERSVGLLLPEASQPGVAASERVAPLTDAPPRRRRSSSVPRHRRQTAGGDPMKMRRVPLIRLATRRGANERAWSVDGKFAPMQGTLTYPLMDLLAVGFGEIAPPLPPFASLVEAALRTEASSDGQRAEWRSDLSAHLEGARPPEHVSLDSREPFAKRHAAASAKFALAFPSIELIIPAERHTTDCNTARVRIAAMDIDGIAIDSATFKSSRRLRIESFDVGVRCVGSPQYHAFIPTAHNIRGTIASLCVLSPGFENAKTQLCLQASATESMCPP